MLDQQHTHSIPCVSYTTKVFSRNVACVRTLVHPSERWSVWRFVSDGFVMLLPFGNVWPWTYGHGHTATCTAVSDTQQDHYIHIFFREKAVSHAIFSVESNYEDKKGLQSRNMRLHGAFTWRYFRFITIFSRL